MNDKCVVVQCQVTITENEPACGCWQVDEGRVAPASQSHQRRDSVSTPAAARLRLHPTATLAAADHVARLHLHTQVPAARSIIE